jgi:hypothetical protein
MRYMFRPHRAIFRQHISEEFTAVRTLSTVLLKYVVTIVINFGIIGCLFFLPFELRPLFAPLGVRHNVLYKCTMYYIKTL